MVGLCVDFWRKLQPLMQANLWSIPALQLLTLDAVLAYYRGRRHDLPIKMTSPGTYGTVEARG